MKRRLIILLDWIDANVLRHSIYWVCERIATSEWWYDDGHPKVH